LFFIFYYQSLFIYPASIKFVFFPQNWKFSALGRVIDDGVRNGAIDVVDYPLSDGYINVKTLFAQLHPIRKSVGMDRVLKELKFPLEGTHHRGVDDVKNIAKILFWCLQRT